MESSTCSNVKWNNIGQRVWFGLTCKGVPLMPHPVLSILVLMLPGSRQLTVGPEAPILPANLDVMTISASLERE